MSWQLAVLVEIMKGKGLGGGGVNFRAGLFRRILPIDMILDYRLAGTVRRLGSRW
jgi:hypothetical protein